MSRPHSMRQTLIVWPLVILAGFGLALFNCSDDDKKPKEDTLVKAPKGPVLPPQRIEAPQDVLFYALMGNPLNFVKRLEDLAKQTAMVPPGALLAKLNQGLLSMGLKDPRAVELYRPAGMVVLNPRKFKVPMVMALSVKSEQAMLDSLKPVWTHKGAKEGIHEFIRHGVNTYDVFKGGAKASSAQEPESMFLRFSKRVVFLSVERPALLLGGPLLEAQLSAGVPADGLQMALFVDKTRRAYGMELAALPLLAKRHFESEILQQTQAGNAKGSLWMIGWMIDKAAALVQQTSHLAAAVDLRKSEARLMLALEPEPDSVISHFLKAQTKQRLRLDRGLPPEGFLALAFNVQWDSVKKDMVSFAGEARKQFAGEEADEAFLELARQMIEVLGDEMAIIEDIDPKNGLTMVQLMSVRDEVQAKAVFAEAMLLGGKLLVEMDPQVSMGARLEGPTPLAAHDGVELTRYAVRFATDSLPPAQAQVIKQMYGGDRISFVLGFVDKTLVLAMGANAQAQAQAAIDRLRGKQPGLDQSQRMRLAAGDMGAGASGYVLLSVAESITSSVRSTLIAMGPKAPKLNLPESKSAFFMRMDTKEGRLQTALRLPAQHLWEIGLVFQKLAELSVAGAGEATTNHQAPKPVQPQSAVPNP